jgi:hypothetical protein
MTAYAIANGPCEGLVEALRAEFGAVLAQRIIEAEALDFLWQARTAERYLGQHFGPDIDGAGELSRIAIAAFLDGSWHVAVCLADGDGDAAALLWRRDCGSREAAWAAFERAV